MEVSRISDSCGYAVPRMEYLEDRDVLITSTEAKGVEGLKKYQEEKNARSLDGLPALEPGA